MIGFERTYGERGLAPAHCLQGGIDRTEGSYRGTYWVRSNVTLDPRLEIAVTPWGAPVSVLWGRRTR